VLTITLNRPQARNAMSEAMNQSLGRQLAAAELDPTVRCVVLTGAGQGFCAGGDVKGMNERNSGSGRSVSIDEAIANQRANQRRRPASCSRCPNPRSRPCLALRPARDCRWRWPATCGLWRKNAILTTAFARVGLAGDYGGTYFLTQLVGSAKAREMYFLSSG